VLRLASRCRELKSEVEAVPAGCVEMAAMYQRGMEAYKALGALDGSAFEQYNEENRECFWPSLLTWLRCVGLFLSPDFRPLEYYLTRHPC